MAEHWRGWLNVALAVLSITVVLPLATFLVAVWLLGWQLVAVQSGSMAPTYPIGSMLVIEPIDPSRVAPGMAIAFEDPVTNGRLVTHRVVSRVPGEAVQFWTQGDANATRDPVAVAARNVRGHVLWQIPQLGSVISALQWPWSVLLLVAAPAVLLAASHLRAWYRPGTRAAPTGPG